MFVGRIDEKIIQLFLKAGNFGGFDLALIDLQLFLNEDDGIGSFPILNIFVTLDKNIGDILDDRLGLDRVIADIGNMKDIVAFKNDLNVLLQFLDEGFVIFVGLD